MLKPESSHGWLLACRLLLLLWLLAYLLSHFGLHPARLGLGATSHWPATGDSPVAKRLSSQLSVARQPYQQVASSLFSVFVP